MLEAARRGGPSEAPVLIDLRVFRRQALDAGRAPEAAGVQREAIGGEMVGPPVEHRLDGASPAVEVEAGQAVHEINAQVLAAGLPRRLERRAGAARVVEPTEPRQDRIVERLDAEAQPVDAGGAVARELVARHALGIALDGDLGVGDELKAGSDPVEHRRQLVGGQERGRAAAEKDRRESHAGRPGEGAEQVDLAAERLEIARHRAVLERRGVEAAVPAPLGAERHMHVEPELARFRGIVS